MGEIILLKKYQDMKQKKRESSEDIAALLSHMASEVSKILDKSGIEMMEEREIQERKRFEERYKDVLSQAPDSVEIQIQYFAGIMLNFLPSIFHGKWTDRFNIYMDFSEFYLSEFDIAYSQYHNENQEYEIEYPFRFVPLNADALENELQDCLQQLNSLESKKNNRNIAESIMWQASRLFELYHSLNDCFSEKR